MPPDCDARLWATRSSRRRGVYRRGPRRTDRRAPCNRSDHTNRGKARDLPRSSKERRPGWISWLRAPREVVDPPKWSDQREERPSAGLRGNRNGCRGFARRAHHTVVTRESFGFRHLALSRSDQPPLDAPARPAAVLRVHTLRAQGSSRGSVPPADTALLPTRW